MYITCYVSFYLLLEKMVLFYDVQGTVYCKQVNKLFFWYVEQINLFHIIYNGENMIQFSNSFPEQIVFINQGFPVFRIDSFTSSFMAISLSDTLFTSRTLLASSSLTTIPIQFFLPSALL